MFKFCLHFDAFFQIVNFDCYCYSFQVTLDMKNYLIFEWTGEFLLLFEISYEVEKM